MSAFHFPTLLASAEVATSWPPIGTILRQLLVIIFFVVLNGFFVAAEFALVKVREGQLDDRISKGSGAALLGKKMLKHLNAYLSACQFGITVASLVLGALGEKWIASLIEPAFAALNIQLSGAWVHGISWAIAISGLTILHITLGEQVPKTLAIRRPLGTAIFSARPLDLFFKIFGLPVKLLNRVSNWMLKSLFRIDPVSEHSLTHTADEIAMLVEESEKVSEVTETERDILINALELNDLAARDIMTARGSVACLDINDDFETNVAKATESPHTRFPLVDGHLDKAEGMVHVKDVFSLVGKESPDLGSVRRELLEVPDGLAVDELLGRLRGQRSHMALVVDEFGGTVGIVTMEDVLEELVGEIQDEFDEEEMPEVRTVSEGHYIIEGKLPMHELSDYTDLKVADTEATTIGGYVTQLLGHLPGKDEQVRIGDYEVTVNDTDGRRVIELEFVRRARDGEFPEHLRHAKGDLGERDPEQ